MMTRATLTLLLLAGCSPLSVDFEDGKGGDTGPGPDERAPDIEVSPLDLDLGDTSPGVVITGMFVVRNLGGDILTSNLALSGTDFRIDVVNPLTLPPAQEAIVTVTFDGGIAGPATATIAVTSDDPDEPELNVTVTAQVIGVDEDGDGWGVDDDCDDDDASVYPGAEETWYDGIDQDCDDASDYDQDSDGYDDSAYGGTDCNDLDATVSPGAIDAWYDGVDQDCDGASDYDQDADGHDDSAYGGEDCDDLDPTINPAAVEVCDGVDNDCDATIDDGVTTTWYADVDGDGYGSASADTEACSVPADHVANATDCNDAASTIYPGGTEVCDDVDQDCDGLADEGLSTSSWYADTDDDGYGDADAEVEDCAAPSGYVALTDDCDDTNDAVNPGAADVGWDALDNDCDGVQDPMVAEDQSDWTAYGTTTSDAIGSGGVTVMEDLDGDGEGELIVCAPSRGSGSSADLGVVAFHDTDTMADPANLTDGYLRVYGADPDDFLGSAVVSLGDTDYGGAVEIAVGVYQNDAYATDNGAVYIFDVDGQSGTEYATSLAEGAIHGQSTSGNYGYSLAVGDFDGDGDPDLAGGAPGEESAKGRIYVSFYDDRYTSGYIDNDDSSFYVRGATASDNLGYSVALGDLTNDGYDDLVGCAPNDDDLGSASGTCWLVTGSAIRADGGTLGTAMNAADSAEIIGPAASSQLGLTPASIALGDLDDDGILDLALGMPGYSSGDGGVLLYRGGTISGAETLATASWVLLGDGALGTGLSFGDVTGDGVDDLLAGATTAGASTQGVVYLFEGGQPTGIWTLPNDQYASFAGAAAADAFGTTISGLYDIDGDGALDWAASAPGNDDGATDGGKVYVLPVY